MKPTISIIIPIYNAEQYLHRCVDSIIAQTYKDFEIILVNDGSTDQSGEICDEYASKDKRVRVFHKKNGGVSSARNIGLDAAKGEWITFSDSDDWLEPDAFAYYNSKVEELDFDYMLCGHYHNDSPKYFSENRIIDVVDCLRNYDCDKLWNGLYNKSIIQKNGIYFNEDITLEEDRLFNYKYFRHCHKVFISAKFFYHYYWGNTNSLSFKGFNIDNHLKCQILLYRELCHIDKIKADGDFIKRYKGVVWHQISLNLPRKSVLEGYDKVRSEKLLPNNALLKYKILFLSYYYVQLLKKRIITK